MRSAQQAGRFAGQPLVKRVGAGAVHLGPGHHRETHAVIDLAKAGYVAVRAGVLRAELVARKTQHRQALIGILFVQFLQAGKLRRETALAGGVDDQQHLALELRQSNGVAVDLADFKIVQRGVGGGHGRDSWRGRWQIAGGG